MVGSEGPARPYDAMPSCPQQRQVRGCGPPREHWLERERDQHLGEWRVAHQAHELQERLAIFGEGTMQRGGPG